MHKVACVQSATMDFLGKSKILANVFKIKTLSSTSLFMQKLTP